MKALFFAISFLGLLIACKNIHNNELAIVDLNPSSYLDSLQMDAVLDNVIRHIGKLPGKATHETKFNSDFDEFYKDHKKKYTLKYFYKDTTSGWNYFLFYKLTYSLYNKKVGIAGRYKLDEANELSSFEEGFRTWKMLEPELDEKSKILLSLYINGEDLSPFYPENSKEEYIEFPDAKTRYNIEERRWVSDLDSLFNMIYDMREEEIE